MTREADIQRSARRAGGGVCGHGLLCTREACRAHPQSQHVPLELSFFVPCELRNPMNTRQHWRTVAARVRALRNGTAARGAVVLMKAGLYPPPAGWTARPKHLTFNAQTGGTMDFEGLVGSLKACVDGLVDCRIIAGDAPAFGHERAYNQTINRKERGVWVTVRAR